MGCVEFAQLSLVEIGLEAGFEDVKRGGQSSSCHATEATTGLALRCYLQIKREHLRTLLRRSEPMALPQGLPWSPLQIHWVCWLGQRRQSLETAGGTFVVCWLSQTHRVVVSLG
jgi:hypothetical protein